MVLWLLDQGINVRVVAIGLMKDGDQLYAQPQVVLPPPTEKSLQAKAIIQSEEAVGVGRHRMAPRAEVRARR